MKTRTSNGAMRLVLLGGALGLAAMPASASVESRLVITSPQSGDRLYPGKTVAILVRTQAISLRAVIIAGECPFEGAVLRTEPPFRFELELPVDSPLGRCDLVAWGTGAAGEDVYSDPVTVDIEWPGDPERIEANYERIDMYDNGSVIYIHATGVYPGGARADISKSSTVSFASSNPSVARLTPERRVFLGRVGTAQITIRMGRTKLVIPVNNRPFDPKRRPPKTP
jgi:hypothetical protein